MFILVSGRFNYLVNGIAVISVISNLAAIIVGLNYTK